MLNQDPEQLARDEIYKQLKACGWIIQSKNQINLSAGAGVAVREYQTDIGPEDYVLLVDKKPVGILFKEQNNIAQEIESHMSIADKMEESITQRLQQAEALRQSILKKAFEGRLV